MLQLCNNGQPNGIAQSKTTPKGLSSSEIHILPSMPLNTCDTMAKAESEIRIYEKPGYNICSFVDTFIDTPAGPVPRIKTTCDIKDMWSTFYVRCGIHRNEYTVAPGLYCIGNPDADSEIIVTANFKLTFDHLRRAIKTINAWILVLDTNGINVWCAASKGTFSTNELVRRIELTGLDKLVNHRRVILPQLGATGVNGWQVKKDSGFKVVYGPVRAKDIPAFLNNDLRADKDMRLVTFTLYERLVLTPVELAIALKPAILIAIVLFLLSCIGPSAGVERGFAMLMSLITGIVSGAFITPVLLPFLPGRAFALKGIVAGCITELILLFTTVVPMALSKSEYLALFLFGVTTSSFLAMNFTGSTPFTSPSGVEKEMKHYMPLQILTMALAAGLWIYSAF